MTTWSPHLYRQQALARGLSEATIAAALESMKLLTARGIPPILTLKHLAKQVEVDYLALRSIVERRHPDPYRVFQISKRTGGYRRICIPCPELLIAQRWIHRYILSHQHVHSIGYAFHSQGGILRCASQHCGARWLIKIDVRQFFESISERQVFRAFKGLGFCKLLALELTRICTRQVPSRTKCLLRRWQPKAGIYKFYNSEMNTIGHLPQGAPTSPMLSNLCMEDLDAELAEYADRRSLAVTRYADDIVFSTSDGSFRRTDAIAVMNDTRSRLQRFGLILNAVKSMIVPPGARKIVLGLLVDREAPRLPRDFKSTLDAHLYGLEKHGAEEHARFRRFDSVYGMRRYLAGLISFSRAIEKDFGDVALARLNNIAW